MALLVTGIGFVPASFAVTGATVTVPATTPVTANSGTTNITGISVGGLTAGTTYLVAVGMNNNPSGSYLRMTDTASVTASYGFTSGSNTFASFTNISFRGALTDVNAALASLKYTSGASGATNPLIKVTATSYNSSYAINGTNGHLYKFVSGSISYYDARSAAQNVGQKYQGLTGYVVTITSSDENSFVNTAIQNAQNIWISAVDDVTEGYWKWDRAGGSPEADKEFWRSSASCMPSSCGTSSYLSTGANYTSDGYNYSNWCANEPNNADGGRSGEDSAVTNWGGGSCWNDLNTNNNSGIGGYVIEYGTNDAASDYGFNNVDSDQRSESFTLSYTPTLSGTTQTLNATYGTAAYDTITATNGTGTKTFALTSSPSNAGITLVSSVTNQTVLTVANTVSSGTYYETITATDAASVTATFLVTVTVSNPSGSDTDSAILLNGTNQYASASSDVAGFDISNAISIEAWIYPTGSNCDGNIVVKAYSYYLYCDTGILYYAMASTSSNTTSTSTGLTIPVNQWSHVALTRAASTNVTNIYVDGNLLYSGNASGAGSSALYNSPYNFNIGARDAGAKFFEGQIDEVKLWSVARSQSQIQTDLKTYGGSLSDNLVAYYDFNELSGTKLFNRSTGGSSTLDLTIFNSPTLATSAISATTTTSVYSTTTFKRTYLVANSGWKAPATVANVEYLVVAGGGGGGGGYQGGGGGGGGYRSATTSLTLNSYYPVEVGVGGKGAYKTYGPQSGSNSRFNAIYATGGGSGATEQSQMSGPTTAAATGGSGGGGGHAGGVTGANGNAGSYSPVEGYRGGDGHSCFECLGGGGGGASAVGATGAGTTAGDGGAGKNNSITGTSVGYAGGGGGSGRINTVPTTTLAFASATHGGGAGGAVGYSGTVNTGGGGGAGAAVAGATGYGGSGGSGIVVIRYLVVIPVINLQPASDTTTAGIVDSFTVSTSEAPSPLTRTVKWQYASDTTTAVASVTWIDVSSGSGYTTDTFTTGTLTTAMNKYRYRAIVTFTNSDLLTSVETSSVATLTINPAISITSTQTAISKKYGSSNATRTVTYTGGTDTKTVTATSTSLASGKITFDTTTALFTIDTRTAVGTYYDTITITDAKGATTSYTQEITFTVADTLTVTSDTPTALTFTGSAAVFTPSVSSVSGLITGDVISGATFNYSASTATCANGGACSLGQTGPGGGLVFITPTTTGNTTGKYFEAAPSGWSGSASDPLGKFCTVTSLHSGALGTAIGTGEANTTVIAGDCISIADTATALVLNGKDDWFIPSLDELHEMYSSLYKATPSVGGFTGVNYWSSSDHPTTSGWALQGWFGSTDGITGWGGTDEAGNYSYRPVRSFVATSTSTVNYGPSVTKPTNVATYVITPSGLTFSSGATSNYANITYRTSTLTIDKAAQATLTVVPIYQAFLSNPTSATMFTTGGSDTGTVTYAYVPSGSTAGGCTLSGSDSSTITVTSEGTCRIVATKAATANYLVAISDTQTVTFHLYISNQPIARPQEYPTEIVLVGENAMSRGTNQAPVITSGTSSAASPGGTITLIGSGFLTTTSVAVCFTSATFTINSDTSLTINVPSGIAGISGPILIENTYGTGFSDFLFTGL